MSSLVRHETKLADAAPTLHQLGVLVLEGRKAFFAEPERETAERDLEKLLDASAQLGELMHHHGFDRVVVEDILIEYRVLTGTVSVNRVLVVALPAAEATQ